MAVSQWNFSKGYGTTAFTRTFAQKAHPLFLDNTTPIGPCLVAAHAVPDPQKVPLKTVVNGKTLQDGTTAYGLVSVSACIRFSPPLLLLPSDQIFNIRHTISFLSQGTTLLPGSIIMTGTPKGVGFVKKPPVFLKDGDDMSIWIGGGIGTLVNPVVEERGNVKAKL